ncbi:hypothetical protein GEMRC1_003178 [Eukaryota sp. GEM-RC1]
MRLELETGLGLHPFCLGMSFRDVMKEINEHDNIIPSVRFSYHERKHLSHPLRLNLEQNGLVFSFEASSQRLSLIEVNCPNSLNIFFKRDGREIDFLGPSLPAKLNFFIRCFWSYHSWPI